MPQYCVHEMPVGVCGWCNGDVDRQEDETKDEGKVTGGIFGGD